MSDLKISVDITELTGLIKTTDQTKQALRLLGQVFSRTNDQSAYLKGINQIVTAQKKLSKDARMSRSEIMKLGAQYRQQTLFAEELARATQQASVSTERLAHQSGVLRQRMSRASVAVQQIGYQTGDFLVQVQSGTNAFVAFGQQATQLAGLLTMSMNPAMVILGASLSILIPLTTAVAAAFMRTRDSVEENIDPAQKLLQTYRRIEGLDFSGLASSASSALREFAPLITFLREEAMAELQSSINEVISGSGITEMVVQSQNEFNGLLQRIERLQREAENAFNPDTARDYANSIALVNGQLDETGERLNRQQVALGMILNINAQTREEYLRQAQAVLEYLESAEMLDPAMRAVLRSIIEAVDPTGAIANSIRDSSNSASSLASEMSRAANEALRFISNLNSGGGVNAAIGRVAGLRAELRARQGGAGDVAAAEARARAEVTARPEYQLAMQGPVGLQEQARQGLEAAVTEARLQAEAQALQGQISDLSDSDSSGPDAVERLQQEIAFRQRILNLSQDERNLQSEIYRITQALGDDRDKYSTAYIENLARQNIALQEQERVIEEATRRQNQLAESIAGSFGDALMSMVDGTKSAKEAFRTMAADIIKELYRVLVVQRLVNSVTSALSVGGGLGGVLGGILGGRASGGTMMANSPYLVGEHGPEIVMPGRSGTVANADLTRKAMNGSGETTVVNQTINISTGVQQTVRNEIKQLMPQIAESAKSAVLDAKRRGGSYGRAFN